MGSISAGAAPRTNMSQTYSLESRPVGQVISSYRAVVYPPGSAGSVKWLPMICQLLLYVGLEGYQSCAKGIRREARTSLSLVLPSPRKVGPKDESPHQAYHNTVCQCMVRSGQCFLHSLYLAVLGQCLLLRQATPSLVQLHAPHA